MIKLKKGDVIMYLSEGSWYIKPYLTTAVIERVNKLTYKCDGFNRLKFESVKEFKDDGKYFGVFRYTEEGYKKLKLYLTKLKIEEMQNKIKTEFDYEIKNKKSYFVVALKNILKELEENND